MTILDSLVQVAVWSLLGIIFASLLYVAAGWYIAAINFMVAFARDVLHR